MSQNHLVLNTSFKTRDQYAVLEHIGGHFSIQVACFIMLSVPMYTYYDTLNWNSCSVVSEKYMAVDSTKCKDEIYEYGVAYTEELLSKKDQAFRDCVQLVEDNDDCTMYFLAVRMQVLNLICIIGFILTNVYSSLEREHKVVLDKAKLTSKKANVDKSSTHNFFQAWAVITPTMLYLYVMFTLIVKFSSVANLYNVVKIQDQGTITFDQATEPAYRPRPFVTVIMFCTVDFVSQFASLSVLGFVNLFSACKSSTTDRLSDPDWRFNIKMYSVVLNIFVNNIVIVRLVEFEPQFTNFKFMVYIYYLDLFFVAVFMFISTIMLWTKLCFNKIVRFDGGKGKFSLEGLIKCFGPFIKMRFAAVFIGCLYVVIFYRTGQGELPASRQVAYDWIEFQTLMIFGLGIFGLSMVGLTAKINLRPSLTSSKPEKEENEEDGVQFDETKVVNKILSTCLRVSFEYYVKKNLVEQEIKQVTEQLKGDMATHKPFLDKLAQLEKIREEFTISEEGDYNSQVEAFTYVKVNDILKGEKGTDYSEEKVKSIKQDLVSQIATEIKEIKEISSISSVYAPDLVKRFGVFDEVYAEALLDSIVFSIHNTNEDCQALQIAVAAFIKYDAENPSEAEAAQDAAAAVAEVNAEDMGQSKVNDDMEMQAEAPAEGDGATKTKASRFSNFRGLKMTTKNRAYYVTEVETYLNNIAKIMMFNHGAKLAEMLVVDEAKLKEEEIPEAKNKLLRVQPFAFDQINADKATIRRPKKDKVILKKVNFAHEILGGENGFTLIYDFDAAMSAVKVDHKNKMVRYCELLNQFGEDPQKAREAEFDCIAEGGANHVMGALEIIEGEEDKNQMKDAEGKEVDITEQKYTYCSECNLQIVYPRWVGDDKTLPKDGIYAYYCCGFKRTGGCNMVYCISCSKAKILATSSIVEHDEEDKYLALTPDIYSACFLSFITDSSQIPSQPLQDPMQQSAIFQKVQMCFALQMGICFLVLQSSFDNQFQKPDALFLMMQMLTAYLFHATALNDTKSAYLKLKYLYRNLNKFDDSSVLSAYLVCGQQGLISIVCESMNLIFLCKQTTFVDLVLNYVAFAGILAIDDEILESVRLSYQSLIAILEDPSLLKQLKLIKDNTDELTNDNEGGKNEKPKKAYVSVTFHVVRIFYKLVYFYLYPLMVIPLQIYLYKTFVDVSHENKGMTDFFGGIFDVNSKAVEALVAEQMYNQDDFKLYLFRVMALFIALYPLFICCIPFFICIEHYKKEEAAAEKLDLEDNSLNQPLLVNDSMIQGEDENDQEEKTKKCMKTSKIFELILVIATLVLYPFLIVKTADLFLWLMKYEYGSAVVYTCALITLSNFFQSDPWKVLFWGIPSLVLFPILISKCGGPLYFLFLTKWGLAWVVSVTMMAPFLSAVFMEVTKNGCIAMLVFIGCIGGGPFFWYYAGFTGLYYVTLWPAYWILYFFFVLVPYWLLVIPGSYIVLGIQKLFAYLLSFGVFKSVVTGGGNTLYTMVSVPFIEFVYKPIQFIFGKDKAQYAIGLVMIPFAIVCFVALVSAIIDKVQTAQAEKAKKEALEKIAEQKMEEQAQVKKDS